MAYILLSEAIREFCAWKGFTVKGCSIKGYAYDLRSLCLYLRDPNIANISWADLKEYHDRMVQLGWDTNSFVRKFIAYRKFFAYWHQKDPTVLSPAFIPVMHKEMKPPRVIDEGHYQKLIDAIPKNSKDLREIRNLAMINLLWDTGARNGEILSLDLDDLQLENKKALIKTEKAKLHRVFREIFWTDGTNSHLKRWIEKRAEFVKRNNFEGDTKAVFIGVTGLRSGARIQKGGFGEILRRCCDRAGIPRYNPHSFRHHMGHDIIKKGGTNSDVSNILGHSSLQSSFIYTMMTDKELEQRYRKFKGG